MSLNLDKSQWTRVRFGDIVRNVNRTVKDPAAVGLKRIIAMEHLEPGELKIARWGDVASGTTFTRRVQPAQTLFGKRRAYQRKAAYADFEAVCSGDILTFEAERSSLLPEFLPFIVQSHGFYEHALGTSAGSLSPRTNWRDLANYELDLPPLSEQVRIADLLWALEHHRASLKEQTRAIADALYRLLAISFEATRGERVAIADLCTAVVGGIWGAPEGESEVDVRALGPRIYGQGTIDFVTDGSPVRSVTTRQAETRLVRPGDIILERSGGSPTQPVGRVVIAGERLEPCIPTDFQRLLRPNTEKVKPDYLFWRLRSDWANGVTRDYSRKTTNIANLSVRDYLARTIVLPSLHEQTKLLALATSFDAAWSRSSSEATSLSALRSSIFDDIFGDAR